MREKKERFGDECQICSDVVEARHGETHHDLGTYVFLLSYRLDAFRHFLATFLVISHSI